MAWINCGLDQRGKFQGFEYEYLGMSCRNAVARIPLCGDGRYGYEPGGNAVARVPLRGGVC